MSTEVTAPDSSPDAAPGTAPAEQRVRPEWTRSGESVLIAIVAGLAVGAILLGLTGANPITAYKDMVTGTLGSRSSIGLVLVEMAPILMIGLGLSIAFRAKVWNIGAEGQLVFGALIGGWFAIEVPIGAPVLMVGCTFVVGAVAGALWAAISGWLKAQWKVNEVISSLLLNYVAIFALGYAVRKPLRDPRGFQPVSKKLPDAARLPDIPGFPSHMGIIVGLLLVPVVMYVLSRTPLGFRIRMMGMNPEAAEAAGVNLRRMYVLIMMMSGALAGLAGVIQVMGPETRLTNNLTVGYGFTAIVVALIGRLRPLGIVAAAAFIGMLTLGGDVIQRTQEVPRTLTLVLQAVFVLLLLVAEKMRRRA